jgi:ligand-binding sensor domain-containing protein
MTRQARSSDRHASRIRAWLRPAGLLLTATAVLASVPARAVTPEQAGFASERITIEHGLPDLRVYTLSQDRDGMIWVGSRGGLFRFDGYRFDQIDDSRPHRFADRPLLAGGVGRVHVDRQNRVWAMNWGVGMSRLDLDSGRMHHFLPDPAVPGSLSSPFAQIVFEDRDGTLWIGAGNGLNRYDEASGTFELIRSDPPSGEAMDAWRIWSLAQTADGQLWIGTTHGLFRYDPAQPDRPPQPVAEQALGRQTVRALHWDHRGRLWLATPTAFGRLDLADGGSFHPLPVPVAAGFSSVRVSEVWPVAGGRLWLATEAGLLQVELDAGRYRRWPDAGYRLLSGDDFRDVLVDRGGVVWLSSLEQGIVKLRETGDTVRVIDTVPADATERHGFSQINAVLADRRGQLWLATPRGLLRGDVDGWRFERAAQRYPDAELDLPFLAIAEGSAGELWLAGIDGVRRFEPDSGRSDDFGPAMRALGAVDVRSNAVLQDRQGRVWIGSHRHGLFRLSPDLEMDRLQHDPDQPYSLSSDQISRLLEDRLGRLWVGTLTGGLNLIVPGDDRVVVYRPGSDADSDGSLAQPEISAIYHARDGGLWVGGPRGVDLLSLSTGNFTGIGLPSLGGPLAVADFFEDDRGNVWAVLFDLIARMPADAPGASVRRFEDSGGRPFLFRSTAAAVLGDGTRLLGGHSGLLALRGDNLVGEPPAAPTSISRVLLDNEPQRLGRGADGQAELLLERGHGSLTIEFALADFRSPRLNRFRYRMRGLDSEVDNVGAETSARFSHLPAGDYLFEVEGSGPEGVWSGEPARLRVRVLPPWWAEPRVLGALLLLLAVAGAVGFRLHLYRIERRHAALQRTIDNRTQSLLLQRTELEAMDRMVRAVNRHLDPSAVVREALLQGRALFPAGTRGTALLRPDGQSALAVVEMIGYASPEQAGRFPAGGIRLEQLVDDDDVLGPGLFLLRQRRPSPAGAPPMPLASLLIVIGAEQADSAALVFDHYGSAAAFERIDLAALQRYRAHLAVALGNALRVDSLAVDRARAQRIDDARALGVTIDVLAGELTEPVDSADSATQELEVGLARLERTAPAAAVDQEPAVEPLAQLRGLRRQLRRLLGAVAELRSTIRLLRQAGTDRPLVPGRPVTLLAAAVGRLREHRGAWLTVEYRAAADPTMPCIEAALVFLFDTLLSRFVGPQGSGRPPHLRVATRLAPGLLLIELSDDGGAEPAARGRADLDDALVQAVLDRHGGRFERQAREDGRLWRIELPLPVDRQTPHDVHD